MKKDVPLCINFLTKKTPYKGPSADSEEKHEPVSDIDTAAADGLKVLDPKRPIREADIGTGSQNVRFRGQSGHCKLEPPCPLMTLNGSRAPDFAVMYNTRPSGPSSCIWSLRICSLPNKMAGLFAD